MPESALRAWPQLRIARISALTFTPNAHEALRHLDAFEADAGPDRAALPPAMRQELDALRPYILGVLDRHEEGFWLAEEALKLPWRQDSSPTTC